MSSFLSLVSSNHLILLRGFLLLLFLIYCSTLLSLKIYPIPLVSNSYPKPIKIKRFKITHAEHILPDNIMSELIYPRKNLFADDLSFSNRISYVNFMRDEYTNIERKSFFSLVISTYERTECLNKLFKRLIEFRPKYTEIIISDDGSNSTEKRSLLKKIADEYKDDDVYVIYHSKNYGPFHTKLDGFLFSVGEFIMSLDDDDSFDKYFYIDLASQTLIEFSYNENINFVIPLHFDAYEWLKLPLSIEGMVYSFHNHVCYAFRRNLLKKISYPLYRTTIVKDDAPLMIPLYSKTEKQQIVYFENKFQYRTDSLCKVDIHQVPQFNRRRDEVMNGYKFIMRYLKNVGRTDLETPVKRCYMRYF